MKEWSLLDAQKKLSNIVSAALAGKPRRVIVQGHGAVIILAAAEYDRLRRLEEGQVHSFSELLLEMPQDDQDFDRPSITPRSLDD